MRLRWVMLIAGGILVLALAMVLLPKRAARQSLSVEISQRNGSGLHWVTLSNRTDQRLKVSAWMEHTAQTNDWSQCSPTATFTMGGYEPMLVRLNSTYMDGALRVVLSYNPADRGSWQSIETLTALLGIYPKAEKMYIEAP